MSDNITTVDALSLLNITMDKQHCLYILLNNAIPVHVLHVPT